MLNGIWAGMLLIGIVFAALHGTLDQVGQGLLDGTGEAVTLAISMVGVMGLWCGLMEIARQSGLLQALNKMCRPLIRWLYPHIHKDDPVQELIATNMVANLLGLGNAATPAGLHAMKELERLEEQRRGAKTEREDARPVPKGVASNEMCTLLVLNISSLQLLPVTMIAYRSQYGSVDPTSIVGPAIVATAISTAVAVVFCKIMQRRKKR